MPFFDFHLHPSLKPQMSSPANFPSPWEIIKLSFAHPNIVTELLKRCGGINEVVDSQASLTQLIEGNVNLIAIALHPPETAMMNDSLIRKIAAEEQTNYINLARISDIGSGNIYFRMVNEELNNLKTHLSNNGKNLKLIKNISEYNAADSNTIHAVLNAEGPHAFYGDRKGKDIVDIIADFWVNFDAFTAANRIFAMNIAHLQDNDFCNHAYGIQIFKPKPFFPGRTGITPYGYRLLEKMKQKNILVDIKHTSLHARNQLYEYRHNDDTWPIVCTHAGLTGIKKEERGNYFLSTGSTAGYLRVKHYKPNGYLSGTSFNPCSINLYDEDVKEVVTSAGMIGLSLDQRILGTPDEEMMTPNYMEEIFEEEIISPGEKSFFKISGSADQDTVLKTEHISTEDRQNYPRFHARHFLNQVFHLFNICDTPPLFNKGLMARRICIGSDFDGMINPIDCCPDVTAYSSFKDYLLENFEAWEAEAGMNISGFITPQELLDNIFYQNAVDFLGEWYV
jgi:microsomal dipeptidase-like Zn-dependent dipeptidase